MTHTNLLLGILFLIFCLILGCQGCNKIVPPELELTYSDGDCSPTPLPLFREDIVRPNPAKLPRGCGNRLTEHQLSLPSPADDSIYVQVYNGGETSYLRVFGVYPDRQAINLLPCTSSTALYQSIPVAVNDSFSYLIISLSYDELREDEENSFVKVSAYDDLPETYQVDGITVACDSNRVQRLLVGSCLPNSFVGAWAEEMGLIVVDSLPFEGIGSLVLTEVPPGIIPNSEPPIKRGEIIQDTLDVFIENDFLITLPNPQLRRRFTNVSSPNQEGRRDNYPTPDSKAEACLFCRESTASMPATSGDNLIVAVVDGGVENNQLQGLWERHRYHDAPPGPFLLQDGIGYDFVDNDSEPEGTIPHGTLVASAILGGYRGDKPLTLLNYKIFGDGGQATYFGAITAIYAAVVNGSDVINLSWGIRQDSIPRALECAINYANDKGVIVVTSAGNDSLNIDQRPQWPGAFAGIDTFSNVISVASYNFDPSFDPTRSSYSNFGGKNVSLAAYATTQTADFDNPTGFTYPVGTSISAPLVTREIATLLSRNQDLTDFVNLLQQDLSPDTTFMGRLLPLECN